MSERHVALITGASRGIGAAAAMRLADDGYAVAINTRPNPRSEAAAEKVAAQITSNHGVAVVLPADVSIAGDVETLFDTCEAKLGPVHVLVHNAALTGRLPWNEITDEDWDAVHGVNIKAAFTCGRRAFGRRLTEDGASFITISSVLATMGARSSLHYASSKAALIGFTRSLARELGPAGVRVNCILPGPIKTEEEIESFGEGIDDSVLRQQSLQRRGVAADVAGVVSFLAGADSAFVTGETIAVDGGWRD